MKWQKELMADLNLVNSYVCTVQLYNWLDLISFDKGAAVAAIIMWPFYWYELGGRWDGDTW